MKTIIVSVILLSSMVTLNAQHRHEEFNFRNKRPGKHCNEPIQKLDSVIAYKIDQTSGLDVKDYILVYNYDNQAATSTTRYTLPDYTPVYNQVFSYDREGNMTEYIYQIWDEGLWKNSRRTVYLYDNSTLSKEIFSRMSDNGEWFEYQQHFYENRDDRPVKYLRQVKNQNGEWYDYAYHNFVYDASGNLIVLYGEYIHNNSVYWRRTSTFSTDNNISERVLEVLRYDPETKTNILKQELHQTFTYDIYSHIDIIYNKVPVDGEWTDSGHLEYFWSLNSSNKVSICHNGHTICVSVNALRAHLAHGDKIGECDEPFRMKPDNGKDKSDNSLNKISVYPNPAESDVRIRFSRPDHGFSGVYIISQGGKAEDYFNLEGRAEFSFSAKKLKSGSYFLRFVGESEEQWEVLIRK